MNLRRHGPWVLSLVLLFVAACAVEMRRVPRYFYWGGRNLEDFRSERFDARRERLQALEADWERCVSGAAPSDRFRGLGPDVCATQRGALVEALDGFYTECTTPSGSIGPPATNRELAGLLTTCGAVKNRRYLIENFAWEWPYNRCEHHRELGDAAGQSCSYTQPPRYTLALSGGGLRSAAFSIGVMTGLRESEEFDKYQMISAVSGGAYAAGWFYAQHYNAERRQSGSDSNLAQCCLLDPDGLPQRRLDGTLEPIWLAGLHLVMNTALAPVNLLANGVFGWHANTTPARRDYELRLERLFFASPERGVRVAVGQSLWPLGVLGSPDMVETRDLVRESALPYLIVNASAFVDDDPQHQGALMSNTVYEFALERQGSRGFGFTDETPDHELSRAVAISGAALDSSIVAGASQATLTSLLNQDLGFYVDNPRETSTLGAYLLRRMLFFPFYFLDSRYQADSEAERIYLSDGGHAENLGAYALAIRAPGQITIVDAEHDPELDFSAYRRLRRALAAEHGMVLHVPLIEERLREPCGNRGGDRDPCALRFSTPVMSGSIGPVPILPEDDTVAGLWGQNGWGRVIRVKYIKLSFDQNALEAYEGEKFLDYYREHAEDPCRVGLMGVLDKCPFPQQTTSDQAFSREQFEAYRDLGRWIVRERYDRADVPVGPTE